MKEESMEEFVYYKADAIFGKAIDKIVEGKRLIDDKYLLASSNAPGCNFTAFYYPKKRLIELKLKGNSMERVNAEKEFFAIVEAWLKMYAKQEKEKQK
jgi:hypothetical protein